MIKSVNANRRTRQDSRIQEYNLRLYINQSKLFRNKKNGFLFCFA